jgi:hypothetical protein
MRTSYHYPQRFNVHLSGMQTICHPIAFLEKITHVCIPQEVQRKRYLPDILG